MTWARACQTTLHAVEHRDFVYTNETMSDTLVGLAFFAAGSSFAIDLIVALAERKHCNNVFRHSREGDVPKLCGPKEKMQELFFRHSWEEDVPKFTSKKCCSSTNDGMDETMPNDASCGRAS